MEKSVFTPQYQVFLSQLRAARKKAGLRQVDLASRLGETQDWISRVETGQRRVDVIELRVFCAALGVPMLEFMAGLEAELAEYAPGVESQPSNPSA